MVERSGERQAAAERRRLRRAASPLGAAAEVTEHSAWRALRSVLNFDRTAGAGDLGSLGGNASRI